MTQFQPFKHQNQFAHMWGEKGAILNFSGCGTGKTLACIHAVQTYWPGARVLVFAPLSILKNAWAKDLEFGWPQATCAIAAGPAAKKRQAFEGDAQWVITNHDTVKMVIKEGWHTKFDVLIVDEADAFRNRASQRSRAMAEVARRINVKTMMTGTPTPNTVLDVWHLAFLIDRGKRLGFNFYAFRSAVCSPKPIPGAPPCAMNWSDKPEANDIVTSLLSDITVRVELHDVVELPETIVREMQVDLPAKLRREYEDLRKESMLLMESGQLVNAIHAGSRFQKLLQVVSGAVYDGFGNAIDMHTDRHELVLDLAEETDVALVAFNWRHQRVGLEKEAKKRKLSYAVIDGTVPAKERDQIVADFQNGKYRVLFAHPQSAGHGLTLTRANRVIWASPTFRADLYEQFNHRIVRTGQKRKTEIIHIAADHTIEQDVYLKLMGKRAKMEDLLDTLSNLADAA